MHSDCASLSLTLVDRYHLPWPSEAASVRGLQRRQLRQQAEEAHRRAQG